MSPKRRRERLTDRKPTRVQPVAGSARDGGKQHGTGPRHQDGLRRGWVRVYGEQAPRGESL